MDYLGAEISKKIKSAIRAKLVELGVYVDDELPDYIMVLVANKKTKSQMERDLALFLSDHTVAFVEWLQQVLDKLQTITLQSKEKTGEDDKGGGKARSTKEREKKRKSSDIGSEGTKKSRTDDVKEKERKRSSGEPHKSKKDKDHKHTDKEAKHSDKDAKHSDKDTKHTDKDAKHADAKHSDGIVSKKKEDCTKSRDSRDADERARPRESRASHERRATEERTRSRERPLPAAHSSESTAAGDGRRHPRVSAPAEAATRSTAAPPEDEEDQDVLNLSAEEDELVKEAPAPRSSAAVPAARPATAPAAAPAAAPAPVVVASAGRQLGAVAAVPAVGRVSSSGGGGGGGGGRVVNLREEAGVFGRRVVTEESPGRRRSSRSRSPVRRREVKVTDSESRPARRGPQSTVGAVVSREVDDSEYDPLNPAVGAVASTVRVTERPRRPASQQPRPTLLLKAMRDAQRSTVASVRPFLVRAQGQPAQQQQQRNKRETRELYTASLAGRQRRAAAAAAAAAATDTVGDPGVGAPRAVQARSQRSGSPGQIAVTVRNTAAAGSPVRRRRRRSRQTDSPPGRDEPDPERLKEKVTAEEESRSPEPSSDEEDTVNVTIGKVKAHPHHTEPEAEVPEYKPTPTVLPSVDDISAIVHAVADRIKNPPRTERPSSPTFVVTMTGLGASRFARSMDADAALEAEDPVQGDLVVEEEEEEEEELEEDDLRQQLLEDRARKTAHPVVAPPPLEPEVTPAVKPATRCRFWPNCKLGTGCSFHHPSVPCKTFPACKFGDACLYVHPACKFDGSCARPDCRFTHSGPRPAVASKPAVQLGGGVAGRPAARPGSIAAECKFFPNCTNPVCPFTHPKMCRYGEACSNPSCLFAHPAPAAGRPQFRWVAPGAI